METIYTSALQSSPILLFRRSWAREYSHPRIPGMPLFTQLILAKDQDHIISHLLSPDQVHETDDQTTITPVSTMLYCLVEAPNGLNLSELARLNNCPVVSYTGYVPECEGTVVVIELLD